MRSNSTSPEGHYVKKAPGLSDHWYEIYKIE
jgi:hypothetical protein